MIRVMVDADLILEALLNRRLLEVEMESLLDEASISRDGIEMHVTDLGLQKIQILSAKLQDRQIADAVIRWIGDRVQTFAVGRSMLQAACLSPLRDFESAIELASASFLHLDAIVTHKPDDFTVEAQSFPVWSVDKLRERLALESLLSPSQYNSLIKDLLKLDANVSERHEGEGGENTVNDTEALEFLKEAIKAELNTLAIANCFKVDKLEVQRAVDLGISHFLSGDLTLALESFKLAAQTDPFNCRYLLGIARTNKQIGKHLHSFLFAIAALSNAKEAVEKSLSYSLIAGIYCDLFSEIGDLDYAEESLNFYAKARAEHPLDVLPVWNTISTCFAIFKRANRPIEELTENYLNRARNYLIVLKYAANLENSNWSKYKYKIIQDAKSMASGLPDYYQEVIEQMQAWN